MVADDSLMRAIAAIKGGDKETGKRLLANFLHTDPRNVAAWLWLAQAVDDVAQKRDCYNCALKIDPSNKLAEEGLSRLDIRNRSMPPLRQKRKKIKLSRKARNVVLGVCVVAVAFACCTGIDRDSTGVGAPAHTQRATPRPKTPTPDSGDELTAYIMCQEFIEDRLVAPRSAKWPYSGDISIERMDDKEDETYLVVGYLDSQNRMGAMIRTYYICQIAYIGNERWRLESLVIDD